MKRLVDLGQLEKAQHEELSQLLKNSNIITHESESTFFDFGAIWVRDEDFGQAKEILRKEATSFSARARETWERQWQSRYGGSYLRWFGERLAQRPIRTSLQLLLLLALIWLFVWYPLMYVLRSAISE